jgi:hypothetical protein
MLAACALAWPLSSSGSQAACLSGRQSSVLVTYTRTGGFVGIYQRLVVYRSGRATLVRRAGRPATPLRIPCRSLRRMRVLLDRARFATLRRVYASDTPVSDGFMETTRYRGRSVRVDTGAAVPARLARALEPLRNLAAGEG